MRPCFDFLLLPEFSFIGFAALVELRLGITRRQLERLFQEHLFTSPVNFYLRLRLARARHLLRQISLSFRTHLPPQV